MNDHDDREHGEGVKPWWHVPPPWECVGCGEMFGLEEAEWEHFEGTALCADAACSRRCRKCFIARRQVNKLNRRWSDVDVSEQEPGTHYVIEPHQTTIIGPTGVVVEKIFTLIAPPIGTPWPDEVGEDD